MTLSFLPISCPATRALEKTILIVRYIPRSPHRNSYFLPSLLVGRLGSIHVETEETLKIDAEDMKSVLIFPSFGSHGAFAFAN